jgi:hypothetical protein
MIMDAIQTANFVIGFNELDDNGNRYGWFDHNERSDGYGGLLWFKGGELAYADYMPDEVLDAIEAVGFDVNEMRPIEGA